MERLDQYDIKPKAMLNYLAHCGWHFNKPMCKFALKHLPKKSNILEKSKIDSMLQSHNITLQNNQLYDLMLKNAIELNNLKSTIDFIITNYSSKTMFKQLFGKLLELNIKNFILTTQDCINTVYYISAKTQFIYTDGTIEYGIYNKKYQEL